MTTPTSSHETIVVTSNATTILNVNMTNVQALLDSYDLSGHLDGYDLSGHLDGSTVIPPPTVMTDGETTANPAYLIWKRQDRLIYSALLGAITVAIQPILSTTTTTAQIWDMLSAT